MSYFVSPVLGMSLPVAGTAQAFEIAVQNANMALIEGGFTSDRVTLGTHTTQIGAANTNISALQAGVGRSTSTEFFVADLAGLAAITGVSSPAASNGDTAIVAEGGALFTRLAGVWVQQTAALFATTGARDTAYAKASGAYLVNSASCIIASAPKVTLQFSTVLAGPAGSTTAGWRVLNATAPVYPVVTAAGGGSAVVNPNGSISLTGTVTTLDLDWDMTQFNDYDVTINTIDSATTICSFQWRTGVGVVDSGANYNTVYMFNNTTTTVAGSNSGVTTTGALNTATGVRHWNLLHLVAPAAATVNAVTLDVMDWATGTTAAPPLNGRMVIAHAGTTPRTGMRLIFSGAGSLTGTTISIVGKTNS